MPHCASFTPPSDAPTHVLPEQQPLRSAAHVAGARAAAAGRPSTQCCAFVVLRRPRRCRRRDRSSGHRSACGPCRRCGSCPRCRGMRLLEFGVAHTPELDHDLPTVQPPQVAPAVPHFEKFCCAYSVHWPCCVQHLPACSFCRRPCRRRHRGSSRHRCRRCRRCRHTRRATRPRCRWRRRRPRQTDAVHWKPRVQPEFAHDWIRRALAGT